MLRRKKLLKEILFVTILLQTSMLLYKVLGQYNLLHVRKCRDNERHPINASTTTLTSGKLQLENYNLIPKAICPADTHILVVAISRIRSHTRTNIRKCWRGENVSRKCHWRICSNNTVCDLGKLRLVFMTGRGSNLTAQKNLEEEHSQFNDIIQGTFEDTYENLVRKSILMLDYAVKYCKSAKFVQKIDDDVHLNMSAINHILRQHPDTPEGYAIGHKVSGYPVKREGKWKLSKTELKSDYYPDYMIGASYIISKNAITALLNVVKTQPLIHIEDVFMGICINQTNIEIIHSSQFCLRKGQTNCAIVHHR